MSSLPTGRDDRRADARHNAAAILDAAASVLATRPEAGLAEIARTAGVSRQTVYAHFPTRDALVEALFERATVRVVAALEAAELDRGPADAALVRLLEVGWQALAMDPFLLHVAAPPQSPEQDRDRHAPILEHVQAVVARGQREGDIDPSLPTSWVLAAVLALGHSTGEEVRAGRMTSSAAIEILREVIPRVLHPAPDSQRAASGCTSAATLPSAFELGEPHESR